MKDEHKKEVEETAIEVVKIAVQSLENVFNAEDLEKEEAFNILMHLLSSIAFSGIVFAIESFNKEPHLVYSAFDKPLIAGMQEKYHRETPAVIEAIKQALSEAIGGMSEDNNKKDGVH